MSVTKMSEGSSLEMISSSETKKLKCYNHCKSNLTEKICFVLLPCWFWDSFLSATCSKIFCTVIRRNFSLDTSSAKLDLISSLSFVFCVSRSLHFFCNRDNWLAALWLISGNTVSVWSDVAFELLERKVRI